MPPFFVRPWDRPRPRLHPPLAEFSGVHSGRTYFGREVHGLTFLLEEGQTPDWMFAFYPDYSGDFVDEMERGRIARYVLLPFQAETWYREFPLFFRPDGTGWLRESWNLEDIEFEHDLSLHEWLEAPAPSIFPFAADLFRLEIAPKLEALNWPKGRDLARDFARRELEEIVRNIIALESHLRGERGIIRATFATESPFFRAGVFTVQSPGREVQVWFDEDTGERYILPWNRDGLGLSRRFWALCDLVVDQITPLGHYFDANDKGAGRLRESPRRGEFSVQVIADKLPPEFEARDWLTRWLQGLGADPSVLNDDTVLTFEPRSRD